MNLCRTQACTVVVAALSLIAAHAACNTVAMPTLPAGASPADNGGVLPEQPNSAQPTTDQEGGDEFAAAQRLELPSLGITEVNGQISGRDDVDIFEIGPMSRGDVVSLDVRAPGSDTRAAIFDASGALIACNDDRAYYAGQRDSYVQTTLREDHPVLFAAVTCSAAAPRALSYKAIVTRGIGRAPELPGGQVVWLELGGGTAVQIAGEQPQDVPAFSASRIAERFAPMHDSILNRFIDLLRADYADYNVTLLRSDIDARPAGDYTTLYIGGYSPVYLGLADSVDYYNKEQKQEAIVYTETLRLFDALRPTPDQIAQAIANVAGHELGHLLGLEHTADPMDLMAEAGSAQQVLSVDASFILCSLSQSVFRIGTQYGPQKLATAVGLHDANMPIAEFLQRKEADRRQSRASRHLDVNHADGATDTTSLQSLGIHLCAHHHE